MTQNELNVAPIAQKKTARPLIKGKISQRIKKYYMGGHCHNVTYMCTTDPMLFRGSRIVSNASLYKNLKKNLTNFFSVLALISLAKV